jgi:peptidoglycan/LPS O-acetylase OafA/YrhL
LEAERLIFLLDRMKTNFLIRSDIVLLRAVAVLLVICYHFFPNIIDFGYLGVDVFLVISGYLMVSSYSSSKNGLHFIVKRAYRLLPALLSVGIICYLLIYVLLRDDLIYEFSKEVLTSLTGLSNYYYYSKLGYFDSGSENKLFLMSWTLSLEFQYYLLIAISLGFIFKSKFILIVVIFLSLFSNFVVTEESAFFLLYSRLWEFLAGGLLYFNEKKISNKQKLVPLSLLFLFSLFVIIDILWIDINNLVLQLVAVIFSILVLSKIIDINKLFRLVNNPMLWIGSTSYSLYLIHWPVLFFSVAFDLHTSFIGIIISIIVVFILGRFNYLIIEKKFTGFLKRLNLLFPIYICAILIIATGTYMERSNLLEKTVLNAAGVSCSSSIIDNVDIKFNEFCTHFEKGFNNKVVIWGDSHASRIARPIINNIKETDSAYIVSHNACPPLVNIKYTINKNEINYGPCFDSNFGNKIVKFINDIDPEILILVARWPMYFGGYDANSNRDYLLNEVTADDQNKLASIDSSLARTINSVNAKKIIVIMPPRELTKQLNLSKNYVNLKDYAMNLNSEYLTSFNKLKKLSVKGKKLTFFEITDLQSDYYFDTNHLNDNGVDYVFNSLKVFLD